MLNKTFIRIHTFLGSLVRQILVNCEKGRSQEILGGFECTLADFGHILDWKQSAQPGNTACISLLYDLSTSLLT